MIFKFILFIITYKSNLIPFDFQGCIGTTAEIFEYYELDQGDPATDTLGFKVKVGKFSAFSLEYY